MALSVLELGADSCEDSEYRETLEDSVLRIPLSLRNGASCKGRTGSTLLLARSSGVVSCPTCVAHMYRNILVDWVGLNANTSMNLSM